MYITCHINIELVAQECVVCAAVSMSSRHECDESVAKEKVVQRASHVGGNFHSRCK